MASAYSTSRLPSWEATKGQRPDERTKIKRDERAMGQCEEGTKQQRSRRKIIVYCNVDKETKTWMLD